jgi:ABC-type lipoprotein release transport system permease subunit
MKISKAINIKLVLFQLLIFFYQKGEFNMSKGRNMLGTVSLIIALAGVAIGAYSFVFMNNYINGMNAYVPPMAKVYYDGSIYSIPNESPQIFNYNQISYDNRDAFNLTSDSYTIPGTGFYQVTAQYSIEAYDGDFFKITLLSNSVIVSSSSFTASKYTNTFGVGLTNNFNFAEGDSLTILVYQYNVGLAPRNIFDGEAYTFFTIAKLA